MTLEEQIEKEAERNHTLAVEIERLMAMMGVVPLSQQVFDVARREAEKEVNLLAHSLNKAFGNLQRMQRMKKESDERLAALKSEMQDAARSDAGLTHTKSESVSVHDKKAEPVQETVGQTIATQAPPTANSVMDRRAAVDAYIDEVFKKTGRRITRTDIWKAARYKSRTEFERWERKDPKRPNKMAHQHFTRILSDKPHLK